MPKVCIYMLSALDGKYGLSGVGENGIKAFGMSE